jgi:hypothetical protein
VEDEDAGVVVDPFVTVVDVPVPVPPPPSLPVVVLVLDVVLVLAGLFVVLLESVE